MPLPFDLAERQALLAELRQSYDGEPLTLEELAQELPPAPGQPTPNQTRRRNYGSHLVMVDGRLQPTHRPQRLKAEGMPRTALRVKIPAPKPAKPAFKHSKCSIAIAEYLARREAPAPAPVPEAPTLPRCEPRPACGRRQARPRPIPEHDAMDLKALAWLRANGHR